MPTYRLHDTTGEDLGEVEHPAPNVEPGAVIVLEERTHPYYLIDAINGSSPVYRWPQARSVPSRHLNRARNAQVVAHRDNPSWLLRSSGFRAFPAHRPAMSAADSSQRNASRTPEGWSRLG